MKKIRVRAKNRGASQIHDGRWRASITINQKNYYIGVYKTREEAVKEFEAVHLEWWGFL